MNEETIENLGLRIKDISNGSIAAIDKIYTLMNRIMFSIAYLYLGNKEDAEDSVHDAFLIIVRKAGKFTFNDNAYTWINTITKRVALNKLKK